MAIAPSPNLRGGEGARPGHDDPGAVQAARHQGPDVLSLADHVRRAERGRGAAARQLRHFTVQPTGRGLRDGGRASGERRVERVAQVLRADRRPRRGCRRRAVVDERAIAVEDEHLGRALRAERPRERLVLVVQVVEGERLRPSRAAPSPGTSPRDTRSPSFEQIATTLTPRSA